MFPFHKESFMIGCFGHVCLSASTRTTLEPGSTSRAIFFLWVIDGTRWGFWKEHGWLRFLEGRRSMKAQIQKESESVNEKIFKYLFILSLRKKVSKSRSLEIQKRETEHFFMIFIGSKFHQLMCKRWRLCRFLIIINNEYGYTTAQALAFTHALGAKMHWWKNDSSLRIDRQVPRVKAHPFL